MFATFSSIMPIALQIATPNISTIDIPFMLNFSNLEFDKVIIYIVAVLLTITVNAEAQALMASVLGDSPEGAKDRFHFNPILHINLAGLICFAVAGFGWPRQIQINTERLKKPAIGVILIKFAGAFANLLLASIAGSIIFIMKKWDLDDQVFSIVISVNIMVFVYNFIPAPPLLGWSIISAFFPSTFLKNIPENRRNFLKYFNKIAPYILVIAITLMSLKNWMFLHDFFHPFVRAIFMFLIE